MLPHRRGSVHSVAQASLDKAISRRNFTQKPSKKQLAWLLGKFEVCTHSQLLKVNARIERALEVGWISVPNIVLGMAFLHLPLLLRTWLISKLALLATKKCREESQQAKADSLSSPPNVRYLTHVEWVFVLLGIKLYGHAGLTTDVAYKARRNESSMDEQKLWTCKMKWEGLINVTFLKGSIPSLLLETTVIQIEVYNGQNFTILVGEYEALHHFSCCMFILKVEQALKESSYITLKALRCVKWSRDRVTQPVCLPEDVNGLGIGRGRSRNVFDSLQFCIDEDLWVFYGDGEGGFTKQRCQNVGSNHCYSPLSYWFDDS